MVRHILIFGRDDVLCDPEAKEEGEEGECGGDEESFMWSEDAAVDEQPGEECSEKSGKTDGSLGDSLQARHIFFRTRFHDETIGRYIGEAESHVRQDERDEEAVEIVRKERNPRVGCYSE